MQVERGARNACRCVVLGGGGYGCHGQDLFRFGAFLVLQPKLDRGLTPTRERCKRRSGGGHKGRRSSIQGRCGSDADCEVFLVHGGQSRAAKAGTGKEKQVQSVLPIPHNRHADHRNVNSVANAHSLLDYIPGSRSLTHSENTMDSLVLCKAFCTRIPTLATCKEDSMRL